MGRKLLPVLVEAATRAGEVLLKFSRSRRYDVREKGGAGLVTDADLAAEEAAMKILRRDFPDFGFLTEESNPEARKSASKEGRFILDPLDGTTNFVHGFPMFCVSAAAEWRGRIVAGCVFHPSLSDTYSARLGGGARLNRRPMRVSATRTLDDSLLTTGFTYRKDHWLHAEMLAFERVSRVARAVRRPGSAALDLAYVARGVFDGFWERRLSPWDVAAGMLLVSEAGGRVTDFSGNPLEIGKPEILASNGLLHARLLAEVATPPSPPSSII
jgi:myo-inositol-1(or 4)-monophosphatase